MTLGKAGGGEAPDGLFQPNATAIASIPNPSRATPRPTPTIPIVKRASVSAGWRMPKVLGLILDQQPMSVSSTAEGVGVDSDGNVFGAEVGPKDLKKYLKK
jgi:hypothetical protein